MRLRSLLALAAASVLAAGCTQSTENTSTVASDTASGAADAVVTDGIREQVRFAGEADDDLVVLSDRVARCTEVNEPQGVASEPAERAVEHRRAIRRGCIELERRGLLAESIVQPVRYICTESGPEVEEQLRAQEEGGVQDDEGPTEEAVEGANFACEPLGAARAWYYEFGVDNNGARPGEEVPNEDPGP